MHRRDARDHGGVREAGGTITGEHGVGSRQAPLHGHDLLRRLAGDDVRAARGLRSGATVESGQGRSDARCREWHMAPAARLRRDDGGRRGFRRRRSRELRASTRRSAARPLRIAGRGTWLDAGRPVRATESALARASCRGITEYVPGDLTLTARAGTTLGEIARCDARARSVARAGSGRLATTERSARRSPRRRPVRFAPRSARRAISRSASSSSPARARSRAEAGAS